MKLIKLTVVVVVLGVIGLFAYDGIQVLNARRNMSNTASQVASTAAHAIASNKDRAKARAIADQTAKSQGDVVTQFTYDAVAARVSVTVSGSAKSLVLHYFDKNLTDNIHASASARPA